MKAIRKALIAGALWLVGTAIPGALTDGQLTAGEILTALLGTPIVGWAVWRVPNSQGVE